MIICTSDLVYWHVYYPSCKISLCKTIEVFCVIEQRTLKYIYFHIYKIIRIDCILNGAYYLVALFFLEDVIKR